jgi:hypothetical protein
VNGRAVVRRAASSPDHPAHALRDAAEEVRARMAPAIRDVAARNAELIAPLLAAYRRADATRCPSTATGCRARAAAPAPAGAAMTELPSPDGRPCRERDGFRKPYVEFRAV